MARDKRKRDNKYYLDHLKNRHPDEYDKVQRGEISEAEAFHRTGIKRKPKPVVALRREWKKASTREREQFIAEVGADLGGLDRSSAAQLLAVWNRATPNERLGVLTVLLKQPGARSFFEKIIRASDDAAA